MMKKMVSMILALVMLTLSMPVFAASEDAAKMREVLLLVKEKISVPEELTEFSGNVSEYRGQVSYYFDWTSADYEKSISVTADDLGRIISYHNNSFKMSDKRISSVGKADLISFAEEFLKKTVPEAFINENDRLFYDEDGYYASGNLRYSLNFLRKKNGILVKDNYASLSLCVADDEMYVRSMNISFIYDGEFYEDGEALSDYTQKYKELFPTELIFRNEYQPLAKGNEPRHLPKLIYRIKNDDIGYMDIETGERLTEDPWEEIYFKDAMAENSTADKLAAGGGSSLTPQEIAEIETIEGLIPEEKIIESVKALPYLDFSDELKFASSSLYKDNLGDYYYRINYSLDKENNYKYFNLRANAKTGEIISISNNSGEYRDVTLSDAEVSAAEKKIAEFLNVIAPDRFTQTEEEDATDHSGTVNSYFERMVKGVKFVDNGIRISFDAKNNVVRSYNLNFTDGEFTDPKLAIAPDVAYEKILEYSPLAPIYIMCGGKYKKAVCLEKRSISLDAVSGEINNPESKNEYVYSDISGHWVEEAATKLAEIQIGISGDNLEPEKKITQEELLRLLSSGMLGQYYSQSSTDELYDMLIRDGFVTDEEKAPEAAVSREDAFVFIIRMAGLERVAKLSDIYKVSYADGAQLSAGKIGYAAILSGLGVVCGNSGLLQPQDETTRAEAIMMTYKYLLSM